VRLRPANFRVWRVYPRVWRVDPPDPFIGGSGVAHNLAKFALKNCISDTWHDAPPACISETLLLEQSALGL
jgi:hypothetical protein